ncbi:MAG: LysR family transcriptional regulator [Pseudomonadota bacterium]
MEMHQVRYFLAVCRTQNFTRAAKECHVTQPALTRAIKKLEQELGGDLFHRDQRLIRLTRLGETMQPLMDKTLAAARAAKAQAEQFRRSETALLNLGVSMTMSPRLLVEPISEINRRFEDLELVLDQEPAGQLLDQLEDGRLELAIFATGETLPERMHRWPLYKERHHVVFPAGHPLAEHDSVPLAALDGETWIDRPYCSIPTMFARLCEDSGVRLSIKHRASSDDQVQHMVLAGLGCSLLPTGRAILAGIAARPIDEFPAERTVVVAAVAGRPFAPASDAFVRLVRARCWEGAQA